jgi:hypothetical protein
MRSRTRHAAAAAVLSSLLIPLGCGGPGAGRDASTADGKRSDAKALARKKSPAKTTPALPELPEETPVTVEFLGLSADKEHVRYRIHVETDRPVEQVDVGLVYTGGDGKQQRATFVWQNVVQSKRQPIEKGKAYEDEAYVGRGATGVACKVLHVVYKDTTPGMPAR